MQMGGDKVQIVLQARDEISQKIKLLRAQIRLLEADMTRANKGLQAGTTTQASWDKLRLQLRRANDELVLLQAESARLKREFNTLTQTSTVGMAKIGKAVDLVAARFKLADAAVHTLYTTVMNVANASAVFAAKWVAALDLVKAKIVALNTAVAASGLVIWAKRGAVALGLLGAAAVAIGVKTAASLEMSEMAFTEMLDSEKKAVDLMLWIRKTANETPFELQNLTEATQRMLAYGFSVKEAQRNLMIIGDTAAATALGADGVRRVTMALGQMQGKQKVQGEEMRQLTEAGIPAWQLLSDAIGMSVSKLQALAKTPGGGNEIFKMGGLDGLFKQLDQEYGGLMKKQSRTLAGLFSTVKDVFKTGMADTLKKAGILKGLKQLMTYLIENMSEAFKKIKQTIDDLKPTAERIFNFVRDNADAFKAAAIAIGVMTAAMIALNIVMAINPVTLIVVAVAALVGIIYQAYKRVDWFRNGVQTVWNAIKRGAAAVVAFFKSYILPPLKAYLKALGAYFRLLWTIVRPVFNGIRKIVGAVAKWLISHILPIYKFYFRALIAGWKVILTTVKNVFERVASFLDRATTKVQSWVNGIKGMFSGIWDGLITGLSEKIDAIKNFFKKLPGWSLIDDFLWTGGPVAAGTTAMVGELGPELFISNSGVQSVIGGSGPEIRRFQSSGVVVPNHLVASVAVAASSPVVVDRTVAPTGGLHIDRIEVHDGKDFAFQVERLHQKQRRLDRERR